jgi:hypothetical protein
MSHGPEHHIEHAEHAAHAVHDHFNRYVTMSIAIVAAVLACVTMLGHRAHNDTLRLQGEALQLQTKASVEKTEMADAFAYYQSKNLILDRAKNTLHLLSVLPTREDSKEILKEARESNQEYVKKYEDKLPRELEKAKAFKESSEKFTKQAEHKMEESHAEHKKAEWLDYGELGLQFGVVLCSLAILTRSRGFWFGGIISSLIGTLVSLSGQFGLFMAGH